MNRVEQINRGMGGMQFLEDHEWIPIIGARYQMGVDGVAVWMSGGVGPPPLRDVVVLHAHDRGAVPVVRTRERTHVGHVPR